MLRWIAAGLNTERVKPGTFAIDIPETALAIAPLGNGQNDGAVDGLPSVSGVPSTRGSTGIHTFGTSISPLW